MVLCRPEHVGSSGSLNLNLNKLQMANGEASTSNKQDSPRTQMIKANLKKVTICTYALRIYSVIHCSVASHYLCMQPQNSHDQGSPYKHDHPSLQTQPTGT